MTDLKGDGGDIVGANIFVEVAGSEFPEKPWETESPGLARFWKNQ